LQINASTADEQQQQTFTPRESNENNAASSSTLAIGVEVINDSPVVDNNFAHNKTKATTNNAPSSLLETAILKNKFISSNNGK
jgi:hypothetical protein